MSNPGAVTASRRICGRCGASVLRVHTRAPSYNADIDPVPTRDPAATGPYFRAVDGDLFVQVNAIDTAGEFTPAGATHAVHHCTPPYTCRQCDQVHQAPASSGSDNNNERQTSA